MPEKGKGASKQSGKAIDIDPAQFLLSPDQIDSFARVLQETMAKQPQLLVLIRGVPGMGKSYVAKQLTEKVFQLMPCIRSKTTL